LISPFPEWQVQPQLGVEERVVTTEKTTGKSTEAIILQAMRSNPYITQKELAAKCGLTEDGVYYVVSKLRKSGVVKRIGGRKLGYWEVYNVK
jgi:ATP-dependent DNA helicase RecG